MIIRQADRTGIEGMLYLGSSQLRSWPQTHSLDHISFGTRQHGLATSPRQAFLTSSLGSSADYCSHIHIDPHRRRRKKRENSIDAVDSLGLGTHQPRYVCLRNNCGNLLRSGFLDLCCIFLRQPLIARLTGSHEICRRRG